MRCISLWQPWGSLWLSGVKIHETRSWHISRQWPDWKPGDRILVHAAQKFIKDHDGEFATMLRETFGTTWFRDIPTGKLLGSIAVTACVPTETVFAPTLRADQMSKQGRRDYISGDFYEGRYAWKGEAPILFKDPPPMRGMQGIFNVPDESLPDRQAA